MANALITGAAGFTGNYLRQELEAAGYTVYGLCHTATPSLHRQDFVADITDGETLTTIIKKVQPTVVAHLAAIAYVAHQDLEKLYVTNIVGTRCLLQSLALHAKSLQCVLLASSGNVYGNATVDLITEDTPTNPANDYAVSKLAMEHMARLWMPDLPIVIARPFNYTGVGQATHFLIPKIIQHFSAKRPTLELGNMDIARDFSDVRMLAKAYHRLLEAAPSGEIFNVGSGTATNLRQILQQVSQLTHHQLTVTQNPALMRRHEPKSLRAATTKLERLIGPLAPIPLHDTLQWMLEAAYSTS